MIGLATVGGFIPLSLWLKVSSRPNPVSFKKGIVFVVRGASSALRPANNWNGNSDEGTVGRLEVKATENMPVLKLIERLIHALSGERTKPMACCKAHSNLLSLD